MSFCSCIGVGKGRSSQKVPATPSMMVYNVTLSLLFGLFGFKASGAKVCAWYQHVPSRSMGISPLALLGL
eukprot:scaffold323460_cov13-Tisochrysis_lutea.AAC.1